MDENRKDDGGVRPRTFTAKARDYELDKAEKMFKKLIKLSDSIKYMVNRELPFDTVRAKHSIWMDCYEAFLEHHQSILPRMPTDDKEAYVNTFSDRDKLLKDFKDSIQKYFSATSKEQQSQNNKWSENSRHSHRSSRHSSEASVSTGSQISSISSKKLKEEQKQAELKAKMIALEKRKEIELAKMKIKLDEEELQLKTDIAISDAKTKILDKYEKQTNIDSESEDRLSLRKPRSTTSIQKNTHTADIQSKLNVNAKPYIPTTSPTRHDQNERKLYISSTVDPVNTVNVSENRQEHIDSRIDLSNNVTSSYYNDNHDVIKHLRKPVSEIRKFGGDHLEFRKFIRQFNTRIVANSDTADEKMTYLEQYTYGEAQKVVSGYGQLTSEYAYSLAIKQLHERYGNEEVIANAFVKKALSWPDIPPGDAKSLDEFSLFLIECRNAIDSIEAIRILEYSENIKLLMQKLPLYLHDRWRNVVLKIRDKQVPVKISDFVDFVQLEAKKLNDPIYGKPALTFNSQSSKTIKSNKSQNSQKPRNSQPSRATFATEVKQETPKPHNSQNCTYCSGSNHKLEDCREILTIPISKRHDHLKSKGHCYGCLKRGHRSAECRNRLFCEICKRRHPTLLHDESKTLKEKDTPGSTDTNRQSSDKPITSTTQVVDSGTELGAGDTSCAMAIIPVKVRLKNKAQVIDTYAFFDPGSSVSFCTDDFLRKLGGNGKRYRIRLNTMGEPFTMNTLAVNGIEVMDFDMENVVELPNIYAKDKMPVSDDHIPKTEEIEKWSHLSDIKYPVLDTPIGLLIGNNVADAYAPFEIATGPKGAPHATRTRIGWIVWNLIRENSGTDSFGVVNRTQLAEVVQLLEDQSKLEYLVKESINHDFPERTIDDQREDSLEDKRFIEIVNESIRQEHGHYVIALPFRDSDIKLPNNSIQCINRLKSLKRKLIDNPKLRTDYTDFMNKLLEKGYMEIVPKNMLDRDDGKVWYIPHHGVYHSKKPDKIRVVFDCSATYLGTSLNSQLLQGPDLTNNLLGVLLRFREEKIAILGDIEAIFHQVQVPPNDRDCLRFFWWPKGI